MKHGDLSNRVAPTIAIRVEDFLVEFKTKTLWDKIANSVMGKESRAKINNDVAFVLQKIFRHTDMTCDLIVFEENYTEELEQLLIDSGLPYNRLLRIKKPVEVAVMLNTQDIMFYVDEDEITKSLVGHKQCINLETLYQFI